MAKSMVAPKAVDVTVVERGSGVVVQTEICSATHERMTLELMRRKRQGMPSTVFALVREVLEREKENWPRGFIE